MDIHELCQWYADILKGNGKIENGVCSVDIPRRLNVNIQGLPSRSVVRAGLSFESLDAYGNALNLGETVILQDEVPPFMEALVNQGIIVSALHNHWLFAEPAILYIHFQSVEPPLSFASKVAKAFDHLKY